MCSLHGILKAQTIWHVLWHVQVAEQYNMRFEMGGICDNIVPNMKWEVTRQGDIPEWHMWHEIRNSMATLTCMSQPGLKHVYEFLPKSFEMLIPAFLQVIFHLNIDTLSLNMTYKEAPNNDHPVQYIWWKPWNYFFGTHCVRQCPSLLVPACRPSWQLQTEIDLFRPFWFTYTVRYAKQVMWLCTHSAWCNTASFPTPPIPPTPFLVHTSWYLSILLVCNLNIVVP